MMEHNMDQVCTSIIVIAVIILLSLGYVEMNRMNNKYNLNMGTCGRKAELENKKNVSAKESSMKHLANVKQFQNYATLDDEVSFGPLVSDEKQCKHKEFEQDENSLQKSFNTWQADDEVTAKFSEATPNKEKAKTSANVRPISFASSYEEPTNGRKLGLTSFRDMINPKPKSTFEQSCVAFNQSDAYASARLKQNKACGLPSPSPQMS